MGIVIVEPGRVLLQGREGSLLLEGAPLLGSGAPEGYRPVRECVLDVSVRHSVVRHAERHDVWCVKELVSLVQMACIGNLANTKIVKFFGG